MRDLRLLEKYRLPENTPWGGAGNAKGGIFVVPTKTSTKPLRVVASVDDERGWDHVSVSLPSRCPTWYEMEEVKRLFFKADEIAVQFHVPPSDHINIHPHCLHLWRRHGLDYPLPPRELV